MKLFTVQSTLFEIQLIKKITICFVEHLELQGDYITKFEPHWSTKIIKNVVTLINDDSKSDIYIQLKNIFNGSTLGGIFESLVHSEFISNKPTLSFKPRIGPLISISFNYISTVKYLWDHSSVDQLQDNEYGLPLKETYSAVDTIIQPNILIQITKKNDYHIEQHNLNKVKAVQYLLSLYFLGRKKKI